MDTKQKSAARNAMAGELEKWVVEADGQLPFAPRGTKKYDIVVVSPQTNIDEVLCLAAHDLSADRTMIREQFEIYGGAGFTMASTLGQVAIGKRIAAVFPVSSCKDGATVIDQLEQMGVITESVKRIPSAIKKNRILEFDGGERKIIKEQNQQAAGLESYDLRAILFCETVAFNGSICPKVIARAIEIANQYRVPWCWNPSAIHFDLLRMGLSRKARLLQLNREEAGEFLHVGSNAPAAQVACQLRVATGAENVVVTCGADGAWGCDGAQQPVHVDAPSFKNLRAVVGMGDRLFAIACWRMQSSDAGLVEVLEQATGYLSAVVG